jgi:copper homeostasis protein
MNLLEVIVTCAEEAKQAEQGGADRLEAVRDLEHEGLTPPVHVLKEILDAVSLPVRVMLRETPNFAINGTGELNILRTQAARISQMPIDGFVLGFLNGGVIDARSLGLMLDATGNHPVTFHRAIEDVADQAAAIDELKAFPQIDRVLANGGPGPWTAKLTALECLQKQAAPHIKVIAGGGLDEHALRLLSQSPLLNEFHVGRAARNEHGAVVSTRVAALRRILDA